MFHAFLGRRNILYCQGVVLHIQTHTQSILNIHGFHIYIFAYFMKFVAPSHFLGLFCGHLQICTYAEW